MPITFEINDNFIDNALNQFFVIGIFVRDFTQEEYEEYREAVVNRGDFPNTDTFDEQFPDNPQFVYESFVFSNFDELNDFIARNEKIVPDNYELISWYHINGLGHVLEENFIQTN